MINRIANLKAPAKLRYGGLLAVIVGATAYFASFVNGHYAIKDWVFWVFAQAWLLSLIFAFSCLSTGFVLTRWVMGKWLRSGELLALAMPVGVFAFFLAMFFLGLLGLYGAPVFILLPLAMSAAGARPLCRYLRRWFRHRSAFRKRAVPSPWMYAAWAFGLVVLGMAYFLILSPANISFDSRWKHLAIAEHYATQGFVGPFVEGWTPGTAPHLPSFFFAWAFLIRPWGDLLGQLSLVAHMEFVLFLWTLVGIGPAVRRMVPGVDPRWVWVVRFLFPGMLLYDSNLSVGTDHIAAIFTIPIFLAALRVWHGMHTKDIFMLCLMLSGGILTKYSSAFALLAFPVAVVAIRSVVYLVREIKNSPRKAAPGIWYKAPLLCLALGLLFTSPHWLKNWVWYGSPVYPSGGGLFDLTPWHPHATDNFKYGYLGQIWRPPFNWDGLMASFKVLLTFSIKPHDWAEFHGRVPVFGSLFTLALLCLPFVRGSARLWALFLNVHMGIFTWYWIHHQDRHLQTLMPLMAAGTAAVFFLVWRSGILLRGALALAICLQIVWGGDVWFFPTHNMAKNPIAATTDLIASGYTRKREMRLRTFTWVNRIRQELPKGSKVLLHDIHTHTGLGAPSISDFQGWQAGISYGHLQTPGAIYDKLKEMGVTHLVWQNQRARAWDTLAGDVAFWNFALKYASNPSSAHGYTLAEMPSERPTDPAPDNILVLGCGSKYKSGLYSLDRLMVPAFGKEAPVWPAPNVPVAPGADLHEFTRRASFVLIENKCGSIPVNLRGDFELAARRKRHERIPLARDDRKDTWEIWRRVREDRSRPPRLEPVVRPVQPELLIPLRESRPNPRKPGEGSAAR